ncbi:MAG: hypothetical protein WCE79_26240 [Xanthobacteraceae bacterium]
MAKAESRSITRRAVVAGPVLAALPGEAVAQLEQSESRERDGQVGPGLRFAPSGLQNRDDPIYAAIAAHARAYAACLAYHDAEPGDEVGLEPLLHAEREAAEALAATVPATLEGTAAALAHLHLLDSRDNYPALDDYWCYVLIASADTALQRVIRQGQ